MEPATATRRRRRWSWIAGAAALACTLVLAGLVFVAGCVSPDATSRLARQFDLRRVGSPEIIREGLLSKVPVGTPMDEVLEFLHGAGIGKDGLSSVYLLNAAGNQAPPTEATAVFCRIEFDPRTFGFVKESYGISFDLDDRRLLRDVVVHRWLTGL